MKKAKKMKQESKIFILLFILFISISLSSCGKASRPEPLDGSGYPHTYPRI